VAGLEIAMADTGAPWNIPYVEPTDNPRVFPAADEAQALAVAAGLTSASLIRQVVQTVKTDAYSMNSATFTTVTGATVSITPQTNTNKVLVIAQYVAGVTGVSNLSALTRISGGNSTNYVGDLIGTAVRAVNSTVSRDDYASPGTIVYLDSPGTTSPVTYALQIRRGGTTSGTVYIGRTNFTTADFATFPTSITAIEVAA